jgi:hypothetical protein
MTWTVANLVIQIITGILGGHAAAAAAHEHGFGVIGHTAVGAAGGALSGLFLQTLVATMQTAQGGTSVPNAVELAFGQGLAGGAAGAMAMLIIGVIKHFMDHHKSGGG